MLPLFENVLCPLMRRLLCCVDRTAKIPPGSTPGSCRARGGAGTSCRSPIAPFYPLPERHRFRKSSVRNTCVVGCCLADINISLLDALNRACEDQQFQLKLWQKLEESGGITVLPPAPSRLSADPSKKKRQLKSRAPGDYGDPAAPWNKRRYDCL